MIKINLDGVHRNNFSHANAMMLVAQKCESLGYADNPYEMTVGVKRCKYVRDKIIEKEGR